MASKTQAPHKAEEGSRRRPARFPWLNNQSFRLKLALIVGVPSVVALIGSLLALNRVTASYERAQVLETANASSTDLIRAAAAQAKERGFTSAALSDPGAQAARQAVGGLRTEGDRLLDAALGEARPALHDNPVLTAAHTQLLETRRARDAKRAEVDADLAREQRIDQTRVQSWFDAQTRLILAERTFGGTLFLAQNPYELVIQYNGYIKGNVFVASEFAGRERARIGRIIAGGKPFRPTNSTNSNAGVGSWTKTSLPLPSCAPIRPCPGPFCKASDTWRTCSSAITRTCARACTRLRRTASLIR